MYGGTAVLYLGTFFFFFWAFFADGSRVETVEAWRAVFARVWDGWISERVETVTDGAPKVASRRRSSVDG